MVTLTKIGNNLVIDGVEYDRVYETDKPFYVVYFNDRTGNAGHSLYNGYQFSLCDTLEQAEQRAQSLTSRSQYDFASILCVDNTFVYREWNIGYPMLVRVNFGSLPPKPLPNGINGTTPQPPQEDGLNGAGLALIVAAIWMMNK